MSDLTPQFESAVAASKTLTAKPDQEAMLQLYSLYKQATDGDVTGKRPRFTDPVGRAKWDARSSIKGTDSQQAMSDYIALVDSLK
jgi:diazepam-binding inhibitor (GABA receptor modulating acyl-CoA-binding protein)